MSKKNRVMKNVNHSLTGPKGIGITRHMIGGPAREIRFTHRTDTELGNGTVIKFDKLIGVVRNDRFTWVHPEFSA
jgi:hypothetical protein